MKHKFYLEEKLRDDYSGLFENYFFKNEYSEPITPRKQLRPLTANDNTKQTCIYHSEFDCFPILKLFWWDQGYNNKCQFCYLLKCVNI